MANAKTKDNEYETAGIETSVRQREDALMPVYLMQ